MLTSTFCHVPGLGAHTEKSLWNQGCEDWETYLRTPDQFSVGSVAKATMLDTIHKSVDAYDRRDHRFFKDALGGRESWRAWPEFRDRTVYLDIETDGGMSGNSITTVGLYDGERFTCLVKGQDLDEFPDVIAKYGMIVTFFGAGFDIPMLRKAFPFVEFDHIHLDLCHALKKLGIRGGLKKIEKQFGIGRTDETDGLSGLDAIRLWREYQMGREQSLQTLIAYNEEDVVNLETLAQIAYDKLLVETKGQGVMQI